MPQRRKLQVFVSSTFKDLKEERQTAVEAILTTGHIPAGMELFAGQNEEQMNIIKQWIDESDIYMLLLGGRYGSVQEATKKSYTHLEYEYAKSVGKTIFVVVASDDYIKQKSKEKGADEVMELEYRAEYIKFKNEITGKFVKFWNSSENLQLAIINTLHVLDRDESLIGWIPGNEATNSGPIAEELARLAKENAELRQQISQTSRDGITYNGLSFNDMYKLLIQDTLDCSDLRQPYYDCFEKIASTFGDPEVSTIHVFWTWHNFVVDKIYDPNHKNLLQKVIRRLEELGLSIEDPVTRSYSDNQILTSVGKEFLIKLRVERNVKETQKYIDDLKNLDLELSEQNIFDPHV